MQRDDGGWAAEDGVPYRMVDRRGDSRIARRPNGANKFPPPGGGWAASAGRERNAGGSGKVCTTLQTYSDAGRCDTEQVFRFQLIQRYRPHSSSVTSRFRRADWRQLLPGRSVFARPAGPHNDVVAFGWSFWFAWVVIVHNGRVDAPPLHWISRIPCSWMTADGPPRTAFPTEWLIVGAIQESPAAPEGR